MFRKWFIVLLSKQVGSWHCFPCVRLSLGFLWSDTLNYRISFDLNYVHICWSQLSNKSVGLTVKVLSHCHVLIVLEFDDYFTSPSTGVHSRYFRENRNSGSLCLPAVTCTPCISATGGWAAASGGLNSGNQTSFWTWQSACRYHMSSCWGRHRCCRGLSTAAFL